MALRLVFGATVAAGLAAGVWALSAPPAGARPGIHLKLAQGKLAVSAPAVSAGVGRAVTTTVTVTDARGTGAGWSLQLVAGRRVVVSRVVAACAPGSTCTLPAAGGIGPSPLVLHAGRQSGMGVIRLVVTLAPLASGTSVPVKFALAG